LVAIIIVLIGAEPVFLLFPKRDKERKYWWSITFKIINIRDEKINPVPSME